MNTTRDHDGAGAPAPAAGAANRLVTPLAAAQPVAPAAPPRLLLVDDSPILLDSLGSLLHLHGYAPDTATEGRAAIALMHRCDYDVVLLDLLMPGLGGHDVIDQAARDQLTCKIIVVSGDASFAGVKRALTRGAFDYLRKPYEPDELLAAVSKAIAHRRLERQHAAMAARLRDSEELHRFIVNSSPDFVYMLDRQGCFTFVNDRVESLLGYRKADLIGHHYSRIVEPEDLEAARYVFNERRTGERASRNVELRLRTQGGAQVRFSTRTMCIELSSMGVYRSATERGRDEFIGTYGTARDITERKEAEEVINFQAYHDLLTHLPNRALLHDRLSLAIEQARRNEQKLAVMFLDLDRFKIVNDTLGHSMGDRLLKSVAGRLQACLRKGDTLARFGGDEFTLLLPQIRSADDVVVIARKILDKLAAPFVIDGHELFVGASIGMAVYPEAGTGAETLIQNADIAMYHIKSRGKNGYQFFSEEMNQQFTTRLSLERELRAALAAGELDVHYQPLVALDSGRIVGVEALARWPHPERGLIPPAEFIPLAVETGIITALDDFVQRRATVAVQGWRDAGHDLGLALNISALGVEQDDFVPRMLGLLREARLDPAVVCLEITENVIMQDMNIIVPKLRQLRTEGMRIAIDDFGTGYSSLSYLQQFPVDTLKIDRSFVEDIRADQGDASIINAIIAMARGLGLDLVAEGAESRAQLQYLARQGCPVVQGFIFAPAVPAERMSALLAGGGWTALRPLPGDGATAPDRPGHG